MKKGFTLVELLAVIIILAIVMVITIPKVLNSIRDSKIKAFESDIVGIYKSIENHINRSQMGLSTKINDSIDYDYNCPSEYWSEDKTACTYIYDSSEGIESLVVRVEWDLDNEYSHLIYDGSNYEYISLVPIIYGVRFENSSTGIRTDDAIGMEYSDPSESPEIESDFDEADIYSEIVEVTEDGNKFVKIPKFYIKKTKSITGNIWTYQISKTKVDNDYYLPACFMDEQTNTVLPYILVGKYTASLNGTKLESKTDTTPYMLYEGDITIFRDAAIANGSGYQLMDIHVWDVLQTLFYIEFATLDSQSVMRGFTNYEMMGVPAYAYDNGTADGIVKTGSPVSNADGFHAMKYRGIENLYGNIAQFLDGINIKNNLAYVSKDASTYETEVFDGSYSAIGYTNSSSTGFISQLGYDSENPFINLPILVSETSIYSDRHIASTDEWQVMVLVGGQFYSKESAGISNYNTAIYPVLDYAQGVRLVKTPTN